MGLEAMVSGISFEAAVMAATIHNAAMHHVVMFLDANDMCASEIGVTIGVGALPLGIDKFVLVA